MPNAFVYKRVASLKQQSPSKSLLCRYTEFSGFLYYSKGGSSTELFQKITRIFTIDIRVSIQESVKREARQIDGAPIVHAPLKIFKIYHNLFSP